MDANRPGTAQRYHGKPDRSCIFAGVASRAKKDVSDFSGSKLPPAVLERVADRFRLLGDPTRLRLVNALYIDGELTVGELVDVVDTSYGAVSKQLAMLRSHGLVSRRRDGTRIFYRISDPSLSELCDVACRGIQKSWQRTAAALEQTA